MQPTSESRSITLQWVVDAYILVFAVFILTGAALGDRYGPPAHAHVGLLVFSAASAAGALSNTSRSSSSHAPSRDSAPRCSCRSR